VCRSFLDGKFKPRIDRTVSSLLPYKWTALGNTTMGTLLASLDTNIIIVALPLLASDLGVSLFTMVWIVLGYTLVTASILLNFGRLADMFGRVRLYTLGFMIFTVGSGLCSISQTGEQLVVFRIIQSIGAAFLFSNSIAILTDAFPANERGKALGFNQVTIVLGSVLGLVFGGFLTSYLGWRSVFWINIPIGVFGCIWSYTSLRDSKETTTKQKGEAERKIDWFGNSTFAAGLFLLLLGITLGSFGVLSSQMAVYVLIVAGVSLLVTFAFIELNIDYPMFQFSLFKIKAFLGGNLAILLNSIARGDFTLLISFYLQGASMMLSPSEAGIYLIPVSASLAVSGIVSGWLSDKYGTKFFTGFGLVVSGIGFLLLIRLGSITSFVEILLPFCLIGSGFGIFASPNRVSVMNSVPPNRRGVSASTGTTLLYVGRSLSLGISFLILTSIMPSDQVKGFLLDYRNESTISIISDTRTANQFISGMHIIFLISAVLIFSSIYPAMIRDSYFKGENEQKTNQGKRWV
jgi:EmrB/QacA subfamily drug resistance transporter